MKPSRETGNLTTAREGITWSAQGQAPYDVVALRPPGEAPVQTAPPPPTLVRQAAPRRPRVGRLSKLALALGVVVLAVAVLWTPVAVPALVKFPTNTNVRVAYTGSLLTYVNAKTGATLKQPVAAKLAIDRHLQAMPAASSSSLALVKETMTVQAGAVHMSEVNVYALDRRTMQAVASSKAYTFKPGNNPNRMSSYYVTLPMGLTSTTKLPMWKPESGTTYLLHPLGSATAATPATLNGLKVMWYTGSLPMTLAPAYERASLAARGFPMSLTSAEVEAQLAAAGVPVSRLTAALPTVLTSSQLKALLAVLGKPVSLQYFVFGSGELAAESRTGTIIKLQNVIDGVAVRPDPASLRAVTSILDLHLNVPVVATAVAVMRRMEAAPPQPVYELRYTETPAAVTTMVNLARNQINQLAVAQRDLPIGLGVLGLLLVAPAVVRLARRRPGGPPDVAEGVVEPGISHHFLHHHRSQAA